MSDKDKPLSALEPDYWNGLGEPRGPRADFNAAWEAAMSDDLKDVRSKLSIDDLRRLIRAVLAKVKP